MSDMRKRILCALTVLALLFGLMPLAGLFGQGGDPSLALPNARRLGLLMNSVKLGLITALLCMLAGLFTALFIHNSRFRDRPIRFGFLLMAFVPSYIYALTWMNLLREAGSIWPGLLRIRAAGLVFCSLTEIFAWLPLAVAVALLGLERENRQQLDAARLCCDDDTVFWSVQLPGLIPYLMSGMGIIFILSITDFSIPSLFQYNVYAMEIFSDFSVTGRAVNSFWLAVPLLAAAIVLVFLMQAGTGRMNAPAPRRQEIVMDYSFSLKLPQWICVLIMAMQMIFPLLSLLLGVGDFAESVKLSVEEFLNSCEFALITVAISLPAALISAVYVNWFARYRKLFRLLLITPLAIPGNLIGIGLVTLINGSFLHGISGTSLMPALGCAAHFFPLCTLFLSGSLRQLDLGQIRAALLFQKRRGEALVRVLIPMFLPALTGCGLLVFVLTIAEVGTVLPLAPPGKEPLSVKIYNYLHYGASDAVSGFCLVMILVCMGITAVILRIGMGRRGVARPFGQSPEKKQEENRR